MVQAKSKEIKFEKILEKLEGLVSDLESGDLGLDKSIEKFEEGVTLYQECKKRLTTAEKRIRKLTDKLKEEDL